MRCQRPRSPQQCTRRYSRGARRDPYHGDSEMGYRVNLGCVIGLDVLALEIGVIDGRSMPVADGTDVF